jgi:hypothetical protein
MSGGSYDYAFGRLNDFLYALEANMKDRDGREPLTEAQVQARTKFVEHLKLVSEAMRDIEWVDSGDYAPGDELGAIEAVFKNVSASDQAVVKLAETLEARLAKLEEQLEQVALAQAKLKGPDRV